MPLFARAFACALAAAAPACQSEPPARARAPLPDVTAPVDSGTHNQVAPVNPAPIAQPVRGQDALPGVRCSVSRQGRLSPVGEFAARDVNNDGVMDIVERVPAIYAQSAGGLFVLDAVPRVPLPWARIGRGERCVLDDPDALAFARSLCPSPPRAYVARDAVEAERPSATIAAIACGRAWGVSAASIRAALTRELAGNRFGPALSLDALAAFAAQLNPPWTLAARRRP